MALGDDLNFRFPWIDWREPMSLTIAGHGSGWVCRVCVATKGIKGDEPERMFMDLDEAKEHALTHFQDNGS